MHEIDRLVGQWRVTFAPFEEFARHDIDELEGHLRDVVEELRAHGLSEPEAVRVAKERIGAPDQLASEYRTGDPDAVWRRRVLWILAGSYALSVSTLVALVSVRVLSEIVAKFVTVSTPEHLVSVGLTAAAAGTVPVFVLGLRHVTVLARGRVPVVWRPVSRLFRYLSARALPVVAAIVLPLALLPSILACGVWSWSVDDFEMPMLAMVYSVSLGALALPTPLMALMQWIHCLSRKHRHLDAGDPRAEAASAVLWGRRLPWMIAGALSTILMCELGFALPRLLAGLAWHAGWRYETFTAVYTLGHVATTTGALALLLSAGTGRGIPVRQASDGLTSRWGRARLRLSWPACLGTSLVLTVAPVALMVFAAQAYYVNRYQSTHAESAFYATLVSLPVLLTGLGLWVWSKERSTTPSPASDKTAAA